MEITKIEVPNKREKGIYDSSNMKQGAINFCILISCFHKNEKLNAFLQAIGHIITNYTFHVRRYMKLKLSKVCAS